MADDKKTKGPQKAKGVIDISIVGEERVKALRAQAAKKVELERVKAAEAQLLEQFENEERQATGINEPFVDITVDLAPYADRLMLDGVVYFQGQTKTVRESVAAVILEMSANTWKHQSIVDGKSENFYRQSRAQQVTPNGVISHILRA